MGYHYTNEDLADGYVTYAQASGWVRNSITRGVYVKQARRIADVKLSISEFYEEHHSLKTMHIEGIGEKTTSILEIILDTEPSRIEETAGSTATILGSIQELSKKIYIVVQLH